MTKHCIIIPCSQKKLPYRAPAFDLYQGTLNEILHSFDKKALFQYFNVFFLSAKFGLIHAETELDYYDFEMPKGNDNHLEFAKTHKLTATKLLKQYASKETEMYILLTKEYRAAFDLMNITQLSKFKMVYTSDNARGIGDHRGRLKKIINAKLEPRNPPVLFRSGCANEDEFHSLSVTGNAIGTSLAYTHKNNKSNKVLTYTLDAIKSNIPTFIDNGLITAITQKREFIPKEAFDNYVALVGSIKNTKNVSIVVPDNPTDNDSALEIIKNNKKAIKWLSSRCQVILPIHKGIQRTPLEQLKCIIDILGEPTVRKLTLGVPCKNEGDKQWKLPMSDIESLFQFKGEDKKYLLSKAHFLGLSEFSKSRAFEERVALSAMYNIDMSADACRFGAIFGKGDGINSKPRKGAVLADELMALLTIHTFEMTEFFNSYNMHDEWEEPILIDYIKQLSTKAQVELWNACYPVCALDYEPNDEEECKEQFERCFDAYMYTAVVDFKQKCKEILFTDEIINKTTTKPKKQEVRTAAMIHIFKTDNAPKPSQLALAV
jgi:hypothetical protein